MNRLGWVVALLSARVFAQTVDAGVEAPPAVVAPPEAPSVAPAVVEPPRPAPTPVAAPPAREVPPPAPLSARARVRGRVGFGFLGTTPVLQALGTPSPPFDPRFTRTSVPLVGARWWTPLERLGVELGLGAMVSTAAADLPTAEGRDLSTGPTSTELALHLSMPVVLGSTEHTILFVAPEFRLGHSTYTANPADKSKPNFALTWDASLKAGVEVFFSFIGLPNLSLEAGVRAGFVHEVRSFIVTSPLAGDREATRSESRFSTSLVANPWDLFTGSLGAHYYF